MTSFGTTLRDAISWVSSKFTCKLSIGKQHLDWSLRFYLSHLQNVMLFHCLLIHTEPNSTHTWRYGTKWGTNHIFTQPIFNLTLKFLNSQGLFRSNGEMWIQFLVHPSLVLQVWVSQSSSIIIWYCYFWFWGFVQLEGENWQILTWWHLWTLWILAKLCIFPNNFYFWWREVERWPFQFLLFHKPMYVPCFCNQSTVVVMKHTYFPTTKLYEPVQKSV